MLLAAGFSAYSFRQGVSFWCFSFGGWFVICCGFIVAGFGVGVLRNAGLDAPCFGGVGGGLGVCWMLRVWGMVRCC